MFKAEILLVDDAKIFLDAQKNFLKYSPVKIATAYNGVEALEILRRKRPDMIVMDAGMPHPDGVSCCKTIKGELKLSDIPVILVSTNSGHNDIDSYRNAGCNGILHKPLQRREFLNKLFEFLPVIERREPRVSCTMPVHVGTGTGTFTGVAQDIAMNGIYVETDRDIDPTGEIILSFRLPPDKDKAAIVVTGRIAWRNTMVESNQNVLTKGYGIEFLDFIDGEGVLTGYGRLESFMAMHNL